MFFFKQQCFVAWNDSESDIKGWSSFLTQSQTTQIASRLLTVISIPWSSPVTICLRFISVGFPPPYCWSTIFQKDLQ
jgi:anti-sigma factor RsiW